MVKKKKTEYNFYEPKAIFFRKGVIDFLPRVVDRAMCFSPVNSKFPGK